MSYHKITASDIQFMDNSKNDSVLICFLKFSGFNKDWPDTLEHKGVEYKFDGQEVMPSAMAGNYAGCAKYVKVIPGVISLDEQQRLLNTDYTEVNQFLNMPFNLSIPAKAFERIIKMEELGRIGNKSFNDFISEARELAEEHGVDPDDLHIQMYYDYGVISGKVAESQTEWLARMNRQRRNLLSQYFNKLQSQQRAESDKASKDRKAYQTLLALQEKFASYTPEQIADLTKNMKA